MLQFLGRMALSKKSFTLETIEQKYLEVGFEDNLALDLLSCLVKKSLVEVNINQIDETVSFSLLETIGKYARKQTFRGNAWTI